MTAPHVLPHRVSLLISFDLWLKAAGYRPPTRERALRTARQYLAFCDGNEPLSREPAIRYLADASGRVKRISLEGRHKDLSMLARWAVSEGLVAESFMNGIPRPHPSIDERERDAPIYTEADKDALLAVCPPWSWMGLRNQALVRALWYTPLRASELCALQLADVDWDAGEFKVRDGKGGTRYEAVIPAELALALDRYLRYRNFPESEALWVDQKGRQLSSHALALMLRRMAKRARITKPVYPHGFRHNFRRRCREIGLDDADISALLGHRSVQATWGYARQAARQMAKGRYRERLGYGALA